MNDNFGQAESPLSEYFRIIRRRKWLVAGIATLAIAGAVSAAFMLPATYQSTATILIEEPAVADDIANTNGTNFPDQRLQLIQQRVMTTSKLVELIDRLGLYREARQTTPANILAGDLRSRIVMKLVGSDASDARNTRQARASTAFTVSYTGRDPVVTQRIVQELVDLYLAENERAQRDRALGTAGFLSGESARLSVRIKELESQLADFKSKNAGMLPEEKEFNAQLLDRTQNQLLEFMRQAQAARERQAFLQAQLLSVEPQAAVNSANPETLSPKARLRLLKVQYSTLLSKYGDKHPDVVRLRRQIDAMSGASGDGGSAADIETLEAELQIASQKYGDAHPDVVRLKRQIKAAKASQASAPMADAPDNPVYIQTQGQLNGVNAEVEMAQAQIAALQQKMSEVEARIIRSPEVERNYVALKRDYDTAVGKLSDLQQRESQAELAKNLETEQMGERLSLIEPPPLPNAPISPNRPAIVLVGILFGMAGAVAAAILLDSFDGRVYGQRRLAAVLGTSPLVLIPRIEAVYNPKPRRHRFAMVMVSLVVALGVLLHGGDFGFTTLGDLWSSVVERVDTTTVAKMDDAQ